MDREAENKLDQQSRAEIVSHVVNNARLSGGVVDDDLVAEFEKWARGEITEEELQQFEEEFIGRCQKKAKEEAIHLKGNLPKDRHESLEKHEIVTHAISNARLEGGCVSDKVVAELEKWANGDIGLDDLRDFRKKHLEELKKKAAEEAMHLNRTCNPSQSE